MRKFSYDAVPASESDRPYEGICFNSHERVQAVYTRGKVRQLEGNPLVEALPRPRNAGEITDAYSKSLILYDFNDVSEMENYEKVAQAAMLKNVRIKPPFAASIENRFYYSQIVTYSSRNMITTIPCCAQSEQTKVRFEALGSNPNEPITLLGYSGSGKSSAIETLLTDYPQVIEHNLEGMRFLQITYLYVECPANSNMGTLLYKIAEEIDVSAGSGEVYREKVRKARNIGDKAQVIVDAFRVYAVGTLFLDEIQNINFDLTREGTYATLLNISNETGVNLSVIGTEEAYDKMFHDLKLIRRVGDPIIASAYCKNVRYVTTAISEIVKYQWFDEYVEFTPEMIKAMMECTGGIFDQIITLHTILNFDYLEAPKGRKPVIDANYIYATSERHFPKIRKILEDLKECGSAEADRKLREYMDGAQQQYNRLVETARQESEANNTIEELESEDRPRQEHLVGNCIRNILNVTDQYAEDVIEKEVRRQIRLSGCALPEEGAVTKMAFKALQEKDSDKKKAKRAKDDAKNMKMKEAVTESTYKGPVKGLGGGK